MKDSRFMKWNNCINQQKDYKGCMFQMLQSQNYGLQLLEILFVSNSQQR